MLWLILLLSSFHNTCAQMTYAGILTGGLAGVAARPGTWAGAGMQGACLGIGLSVFAQVLTKPLIMSEEKSN